MKLCQCQTAEWFDNTTNHPFLRQEIKLFSPQVPRQDCQKVPEKVCKPETRVVVVEETEEVCEEEEVTTPKTTTTTTTTAPVTKAVVKPGKRYTYMYLSNSDQKNPESENKTKEST